MRTILSRVLIVALLLVSSGCAWFQYDVGLSMVKLYALDADEMTGQIGTGLLILSFFSVLFAIAFAMEWNYRCKKSKAGDASPAWRFMSFLLIFLFAA